MTATTSITPFNFNSHDVRVIVKDGNPWFVAKDICDTLGYSNSRKTLADHLDDDEKGVTNSDTPGGIQKLTIINESGLYALVLRSRKPEARKFAKWVTAEVLPSIRKTGRYSSPRDTGIRLSDLIAAGNGIYIETEELHRIAAVCLEKIVSRSNFYKARIPTSGALAQLS